MKVSWDCNLTKREKMDRYIYTFLFMDTLKEENDIDNIEIIDEINKIKDKYRRGLVYKNDKILYDNHIAKLEKLKIKKYNKIKIENIERAIDNILRIEC